MDKHIFTLLFLVLDSIAFAQELSAPRTENVYGGTVWHIDGYPMTNDSSRVIISTKSANSLYYCDYNHSGTPQFGKWQPVPSLDMFAGYGKDIHYFQIHEASQRIVFTHENQLKSAGFSSPQDVHILDTTECLSFHLYDSLLVFANFHGIHHGHLSGNGNFTASSTGSMDLPAIYNMPYFQVNPTNQRLYIFCAENRDAGKAPQLWKSSKSIYQLDSTTTFTDVLSGADLNEDVFWRSFGFAPDGRIFLGGSDFDTGPSLGKWIAWSDNETQWADFALGIDGGFGFTFDFTGTASNYTVYYSRCYNDSMGDSTQWHPITSAQTHSNDRVSYVDRNNANVVFCVTDMGVGVSTNGSRVLQEFNDGLSAVQVRDIDMTDDFSTAWVAAKSGIWQARNYTTSPSWTYHAAGTPYYSVAMALNDTSHVYAGSDVIFKRMPNGEFSPVFDPAQSPWPWPEHSELEEAVTFRALEVCPFDTSIVMAGLHCEDTLRGGLFFSRNSGSSWEQILIKASSTGYDVDVWDILFNLEGSDTVAYVAVEYNAGVGARSIYRLVKNGSVWTPNQDMDASTTSVGYAISATIRDLDLSPTGDTVMAMGTDVSASKPHAYYKVVSGNNLWTPFTTSGLPQLNGTEGRCITMGIDTLYLAVENEIYLKPVNETSWSLGYAYPSGTEIYFLYYDELFAGTDAGMNGHEGQRTGNPLPIELTKLEVSWITPRASAELIWTTAMEENHSHFEVERSTDGTKWQTLGSVQGAGFSVTSIDYAFIDNDWSTQVINQTERMYYRLKLVDGSGGFDYSPVRFLDIEKTPLSARVYPNPLSGSQFAVQSKAPVQYAALYDQQGRKFNLIFNPGSSVAITVTDTLPSGVYLLIIGTSQGIINKKLVVE